MIAINDGSKDNSLEILKKYNDLYPESITIYSRENQGVANSRNFAIDKCKTPYLTFLDQDDYLDVEFCEKMLYRIKEDKADIVYCSYVRPNENGKIVARYMIKNSDMSKLHSFNCWAKIHKTDFVKDSKARFMPIVVGEDAIFSLMEHNSNPKISIMEDYIGYFWFQNTNSVSNTTQKGINKEQLDNLETFFESIYETKKDKDSYLFQYFYIKNIVANIMRTNNEKSIKGLIKVNKIGNYFFSDMEKKFPDIYKNKLLYKVNEDDNLLMKSLVYYFILNRKLFKLFRIKDNTV